MYMERIVAAETPVPPMLRMAVGVPVLLLSIVIMLPWLALNAAWIGATLTVRGSARAIHMLAQMADYAGSVALGR